MWAAYLIAAVFIAGTIGTLIGCLCSTVSDPLGDALPEPSFSAINRDDETVALTDALPPLDPVDRESVGTCARCSTPVVRFADGQARCACGECDLPSTLVRAREAHEFTAALAAIRALPERVPAHERRSM